MSKKAITCLFVLLFAVSIHSSADAGVEIPLTPINYPVNAVTVSNMDYPAYDTPEITGSEAGYTVKRKSKTTALLLTVLVPGAGQLYLGRRDRAEIFMGAEVLTWAGFAVFSITGNWKKSSYKQFAEEHAGVIDPDDKDDEFWKNVSFYESREQYNESGRIIDPGGPYYTNTPSTYWQWDSDSSRLKFKEIRDDSKAIFRRATFMIGVAVVNRIIAGIDTFRLADRIIKDNEKSEYSKKIKVDFKANPFGDNPHVNIKFSKKF